MTDLQTATEVGPIDYLIVEYPNGKPTGAAMPTLIDLVDRGIIRVLDVALLAKSESGEVSALGLGDLNTQAAIDFAAFIGASSGLLDESDLAEAGKALQPGVTGAVLVYENSWAAPFATALRDAGAQLVANGRVNVDDILATLDQIDQEQEA
ncbi:MAG: DUF1269 domain-containing protein [Actinomycetia bacterium]|nr:DUF1269 domain-containing protein [Actinomycetes bacterium]